MASRPRPILSRIHRRVRLSRLGIHRGPRRTELSARRAVRHPRRQGVPSRRRPRARSAQRAATRWARPGLDDDLREDRRRALARRAGHRRTDLDGRRQHGGRAAERKQQERCRAARPHARDGTVVRVRPRPSDVRADAAAVHGSEGAGLRAARPARHDVSREQRPERRRPPVACRSSSRVSAAP